MSSEIKFNLDLHTGEWTVDDSAFNDVRTTILLSFSDSENLDSPVVSFNSLNFQFVLFDDNNNILKQESFPKDNHLYLSTDQDYLESLDYTLEVDKTYTFKICLEESGSYTEITYEMTGPRPQKPYESWSWNDANKSWEAPVEYPTDGNRYLWVENTSSWENVAEVNLDNLLLVASGEGNSSEDTQRQVHTGPCLGEE